jgi:hypothetical protein
LGFDLTVMQEKGLLKLRNIEQGGGTSEWVIIAYLCMRQ